MHWKETNALCVYRSFLSEQQTISCLVVKYNFEYMRFEYYVLHQISPYKEEYESFQPFCFDQRQSITT